MAPPRKRPSPRWARAEQAALQPLAPRPYRSLLLPPEGAPPRPRALPAPVVVERRPLHTYAAVLAEVS